jgi:redox-sensing transcriptional repressor
MTEKNTVPDAVMRRLPCYYRHLGVLLSNGVTRISSHELSKKMGITASQIRQDLNHFGGFGQQGYGYNLQFLYEKIRIILGLIKDYSMIVVGAGNLGQAVTNYTNFEKRGLYIKALFDINPKMIGMSIRGIDIYDFDTIGEFMKDTSIDIAIVTVPAASAKDVASVLVKNGIKCIWNFTAAELNLPDDVIIENVYLTDSLISLVYKLNETNMS